MTKLLIICMFMINIYADDNKTINDKFKALEIKINTMEQKNILLKNENIKLIEKVSAINTQNDYIETTYTTIIDNNQHRLDIFLWILASIIASLGLFGFSTIKKYIDIKLNKIITKKENELNILTDNVKYLEEGLKLEYLQKLAEFSQQHKQDGEPITKAEKDWLIYYSKLLPKNEDERTFNDWKIFSYKYFYVDNDFNSAIKCIEQSIQLNPKFDFQDNKLLMYSYESINEYEKAIQQCLDILEEIDDDEIYYSLAKYHLILKNPIDAIEIYLKIKDTATKYPIAFNIANAYSLLGNYNKTLEYLNKCEDKDSNLVILYCFAESYENLENKKEAIKYVNKALEIEPENIEFQEFLYHLNK